MKSALAPQSIPGKDPLIPMADYFSIPFTASKFRVTENLATFFLILTLVSKKQSYIRIPLP